MAPKLKIFVSSTFKDLKEERLAVRNIINELANKGYDVEWVGMEKFGSLSTTPLRTSISFAEQADFIILLVAASYGSTPQDGQISFTLEEYEIMCRDKIPCLAYIAPLDDNKLNEKIKQFRARIKQDLTPYSYSDIKDLVIQVRRDLERELRSFYPKMKSEVMTISPPVFDQDVFVNRKEELYKLGNAIDKKAKIGICGSTGIGKTTFIQHFFWTHKDNLDELIWLRIDDLFGRDSDGHLRIGATRWNKEVLIDKLKDLQKKKPRAIFVFDNVQAAPLIVRWLANKLDYTQSIYLSWDSQALPTCDPVIHLNPLPLSAALVLVDKYCNSEQSQDKESIKSLCVLLDNHPLLLDLVGRQLRLLPHRTVKEIIEGLSELTLEGPTIDREGVKVRSLLLTSYHALNYHERLILSSLAAAPPRGVSEETANWLIMHLGHEQIRRLDRAQDLGLIEGRMQSDWHGHRYRLRSLIATFLKTTDMYESGRKEFENYISSSEALNDSSSDIVVLALESQLDILIPGLPKNTDWLERLLIKSRQEIRDQVYNIIINLRDKQQVTIIQEAIIRILKTPRSQEITIELIQILGYWFVNSVLVISGLRQIWLNPKCAEHNRRLLSRDVGVAAARVLANIKGKSFEDFLITHAKSSNYGYRSRALNSAANAKVIKVLPVITNLLGHHESKVRRIAAEAIEDFDYNLEISNHLWDLFQNEYDEKVKYAIATTLGVWEDERVLPYILSRLKDADAYIRAEICSVLRFYNLSKEIREQLLEISICDHDIDVRVNAAQVLVEFEDCLAAKACLELLQTPDDRCREAGASFVSFLREGSKLYEALRIEVPDTLASWLDKSEKIEFRLLARAGLLNFKDPRAYPGLWYDVGYDQSGKLDWIYRYNVIQSLAIWVPPEFDPINLRSLIHDPEPQIRGVAALVAGQEHVRTMISELESILEDRSDTIFEKTVARMASEALDRISGKRERWKPFYNKYTHTTNTK